MPFFFMDLDERTREFALAELDDDVVRDGVYVSERLSADGAAVYVGLLRDALSSGNPASFEASLSSPGIFNASETTRQGVVRTMARNAASLLAGGEFNRYYVRAVAARAIADGRSHVTIYRARESGWHRPESDAQIGLSVDAQNLLVDARANSLTPEAISLPDVNSGLSVHL
ncbi:MAG: hypothetical protein JSS74_06075 [Actinobacteria bacterium]|nr:hypothetical protein [Actinomycetota bacterium]